MQILYPGRYRSVQMTEDLERKAERRGLPKECLRCDTPIWNFGDCPECDAPFLIGIVRVSGLLYVQRHTEPMTLAIYETAIQTRQRYVCLSCDGRIDEDGSCGVCDAETRYCFHPLRLYAGICIRPDAIPKHSELEHSFFNPIDVRLLDRETLYVQTHAPAAASVQTPDACRVQTPESVNTLENETAEVNTPESNTPESNTPPPESDRQRIRRLRKTMSLREIETATGFSLGKIRHHLKD